MSRILCLSCLHVCFVKVKITPEVTSRKTSKVIIAELVRLHRIWGHWFYQVMFCSSNYVMLSSKNICIPNCSQKKKRIWGLFFWVEVNKWNEFKSFLAGKEKLKRWSSLQLVIAWINYVSFWVANKWILHMKHLLSFTLYWGTLQLSGAFCCCCCLIIYIHCLHLNWMRLLLVATHLFF